MSRHRPPETEAPRCRNVLDSICLPDVNVCRRHVGKAPFWEDEVKPSKRNTFPPRVLRLGQHFDPIDANDVKPTTKRSNKF